MGAFDGVFATRGNSGTPEPTPEPNSVGVFEEVFVRRGRWRKPVAEPFEETSSNVVDLAGHVAAGAANGEYPMPLLSDMIAQKSKCMDPIFEHASKPASELLGNCEDPMLTSEITDTIQFVVKNTFLNTAGFVRDSLREFLSERQVQSCPAGSFNIDDISCIDEPELDVSLDTAASWQQMRTMSFDDSNNFMNTAASWQKLRTLSFDDPSMLDFLGKGSVFNTASTFQDAPIDFHQKNITEAAFALDQFSTQNVVFNTNGGVVDQEKIQQQNLVEERLNTLRMSGSKIQQSIAEAISPAINRSMQFAAMDACFSPRGACFAPPLSARAPPTANMMPVPPPPPPFETAPVRSAVLRLAETLPPPELGGPLAPSMGSMLHNMGECRPCTFFHTRGCQNKETCQFCHLCGPGEKKKRLRQEKSAKREVQRVAVENARAILATLDAAERNAELDYVLE